MSRLELLNKLLNTQSDITMIIDELNQFGWDSDKEMIALTKKHIYKALQNYQDGIINNGQIESWANAIENREDIGREKTYAQLINEILYELANPYLTVQLTNNRANQLLLKLRSDSL